MIKSLRYAVVAFLLPSLFTCATVTQIMRPFIVSDADEVTLGAQFASQITADTKNYPLYTKNAEVVNYIDTLGKALVKAQNDRTDLNFTFQVIDNDSVINAFCVPGGHVFVYTGLLKAAQSGAEVAGVLAHEIGHVIMRHGVNRLVQQYGMDFVNQLVFGSNANAASMIAGLLENMLFLKFSRNDEYQADSCGVVYVAKHGYNPYGMTNFFQTLLTKYGDAPMETFSDHPNTSERIKRLQGLIGKMSGVPAPASSDRLHQTDFLTIKSKI
ncbi:MAG: M48 family metalloprotease [Chitinispirillaceae bacterium]|nr:M48 family metalloprotease [Chitinispirillaceae bacterium]